ncbi:MAG TPA: lipoyl(octanoyl) transferase LipB [Limnochordia bacterium]|jgi:lipoyl(octanoyl) transferase|nr:lipoyl(octanoyl) transferase LipB [Bacillota bacterium]HKM17721.1 lipoyl(octanoyl) transferase LipB [Limnochordia bacterium]
MDLEVCQLGLIPYGRALAMQEQLLALRQGQQIGDLLLLLEHPPVITLGKRGKMEHVLAPKAWLEEHQVEVHTTDRGGEVTYHGPGQLIGYMFIDLRSHGRDIRRFVHNLEQVFITLLHKYYQIESFRDPEHTGVWVGQGKISAIGLAIKRWVTMHGFAFNVSTNLEHFRWIIPCGITDKSVSSLNALLGAEVDMAAVAAQVAGTFCEIFNYHPRHIGEEQLYSYLRSNPDAQAEA